MPSEEPDRNPQTESLRHDHHDTRSKGSRQVWLSADGVVPFAVEVVGCEWYAKGVRITNADLEAVPLTPHHFHGEWNYTIGAQPNLT